MDALARNSVLLRNLAVRPSHPDQADDLAIACGLLGTSTGFMPHALISDWLGAIFALLAFLAISLLRPDS